MLGESNIAHMVSRHPEDYALYGEYIPLILSMPDYVALNTKDESIEYVKEVQMDDIYMLKWQLESQREGSYLQGQSIA